MLWRLPELETVMSPIDKASRELVPYRTKNNCLEIAASAAESALPNVPTMRVPVTHLPLALKQGEFGCKMGAAVLLVTRGNAANSE